MFSVAKRIDKSAYRLTYICFAGFDDLLIYVRALLRACKRVNIIFTIVANNNGLFQPELIKEYQHVIYQNIIKGMKVLVDARDKLNIPWENPKNYDIGYQLLKFENTMVLDARLFLHYVPALQSLWRDASIRKAFDRRREFQLVRHAF